MNILLTGGAGYIGSHTYLSLVFAGYNPIIVDDFSNSNPAVLDRLKKITLKPIMFLNATVLNTIIIQKLILEKNIVAVIHFAACKAVGESVTNPLKYYTNNLGGTMSVLQAMHATSCRRFVFSSSATVYGDTTQQPIPESAPRVHSNPYGHTKLVSEDILVALGQSDSSWRVATLRYFNPVGAHDSGLIGEDPQGIPNNLMPYIAQVAIAKRDFLTVYGNDYNTPDGTGVRDYIHVQDLADAHVAALNRLMNDSDSFTVNIGTGVGYSVLDVIKAYSVASAKSIEYQIAARRAGDVATCYADPSLALKLLGWKSKRDLTNMCETSWRWQSMNPQGYAFT